MPRAKKQSVEAAPGVGHNNPPADPLNPTPDKLISEYIQTRDWMAAEAKRFSEHMAPFRARLTEIENQFLEKLNAENVESLRTDAGTAYKSTKTTPKIVDRTVYLDFCLDNWETVGNEMLQIGAPQIEAFKQYREKREAEIKNLPLGTRAEDLALPLNPPGTDVSFFTTVHIRKS